MNRKQISGETLRKILVQPEDSAGELLDKLEMQASIVIEPGLPGQRAKEAQRVLEGVALLRGALERGDTTLAVEIGLALGALVKKCQVWSARDAEKILKRRMEEEPEVAKRRALVRQNNGRSAKDLCAVFDLSHVPMQQSWLKIPHVKDWKSAYRNRSLRHRVEVIINKDRQGRH